MDGFGEVGVMVPDDGRTNSRAAPPAAPHQTALRPARTDCIAAALRKAGLEMGWLLGLAFEQGDHLYMGRPKELIHWPNPF